MAIGGPDRPNDFPANTGNIIVPGRVPPQATEARKASDADGINPGVGGGPASDTTAIHTNVAAEISTIASKASPVGADLLVIEDSAAANAKKKILISALPAPAPSAGADTTAIHNNVAGEIAAIAVKASPVGADLLIIEDSASANAKKSATITSLPAKAGADSTAIHNNVAGEIAAVTLKAVPVGADVLLIEDSASANAKKRIAVSSLPTGITNGAAVNVVPKSDGTNLVASRLFDGPTQILIGNSAADRFGLQAVANQTIIGDWESNGGSTTLTINDATQTIIANKPLGHRFSTVALLPAAAGYKGAIQFVTDATLTALTGLGLTVVGGGANFVPVYSDGVNWIII